MVDTSQKSTKEGFNEELKGYFISSKAINLIKQVLTPNHHPSHDSPKTCGGRKYVCLV